MRRGIKVRNCAAAEPGRFAGPCLLMSELQLPPAPFHLHYWGYMGIMEKKMETTIMCYIGYIEYGVYGDLQ